MVPIYLLPPLVYVATVAWSRSTGRDLALISGAPAANWWVMVGYMVLGLGALFLASRHLPDVQQRQGAGLVFIGTVFGVVPFIDGGTVYEESYPDFSNKFRWATGLGLRYFTGFGPLRLDFAVPLNKRSSDDDFQFYVSLGQAF